MFIIDNVLEETFGGFHSFKVNSSHHFVLNVSSVFVLV